MSREKTRLFCPGTSDLNWTGKGLSIQQVLPCWQRCQQSPAFKKWWPRSLNLHTASASQSWKTCDEVSLASTHLGPSTSLILNRCPVCSPVIILRWFLLLSSKSPAFLAEGLWRKHLACLPLPTDGLPILMFSACPVPDHFPGNLCRYATGRIRSWSGSEEQFLTNWSTLSFPSIPCVLAPTPVDPVTFQQCPWWQQWNQTLCTFHRKLLLQMINSSMMLVFKFQLMQSKKIFFIPYRQNE